MSQDAPLFFLLGGTGGIGSETARILSGNGYRVALAARDGSKLDALASEVNAVGTHAIDATDADAVTEAVKACIEANGPLYGAANFAGSIILKPAHATKLEEWHETMNLNLHTSFHLVQAVIRGMMKTGGSVLFCSSVVARTGFAAHEAVAAAKAGVEGLMLAAAASYASKGVRFNCIAPGLTDTPMAKPITGSDAALKASQDMQPTGRIGTAGEAARAAAYLLDPANEHTTGVTLGVDGGLGRVKAK
ncbi:MAG: SDR family oxidoreductase [Planctomycetota bacterium]